MLGLSYRLRRGVELVEEGDHCFLVSSLPLRAVSLARCWGSLFRALVDWGPLTAHDLWHRSPMVSPEELDRWLYGLVKRGFLEEAGDPLPAGRPTVSVIIPVRNRPRDLAACLSSLEQASYPASLMDIIVVDDASSDETPTVARRFDIVLLVNPRRRGASNCRNRAARRAKGEILCFLDSDCVVEADWLEELVRVFEDPAVAACGGLVDSTETGRPLDRYEQVKSSLRMGAYARDSRRGGDFFYLPSCNLAVRRELFIRVDGFKEELEVGEDVDLCWRIVDAGGIIEYRPSARVFHRHRNRLGSFCRRRFDYGTSEPQLQAAHRRRRKVFPLWPAALVFWALTAGGGCALKAGAVVFGGAAMAAALSWWAGDAYRRRMKAARAGLDLDFSWTVAATGRAYLGFVHHLCAFWSRYYLLPASLLAPLWPVVGLFAWGAHLAVGLTEYQTKKPKLNGPAFLVFFTLEQLSYQAGVWWACIKSFYFAPVFPKLSLPASVQKHWQRHRTRRRASGPAGVDGLI